MTSRASASFGPKLCRDCGVTKPASAFTSYAYTNRYVLKDGTERSYGGVRLATYCMRCMGARAVKWREENPERFRAYQNDYQRRLRAAKKNV